MAKRKTTETPPSPPPGPGRRGKIEKASNVSDTLKPPPKPAKPKPAKPKPEKR